MWTTWFYWCTFWQHTSRSNTICKATSPTCVYRLVPALTIGMLALCCVGPLQYTLHAHAMGEYYPTPAENPWVRPIACIIKYVYSFCGYLQTLPHIHVQFKSISSSAGQYTPGHRLFTRRSVTPSPHGENLLFCCFIIKIRFSLLHLLCRAGHQGCLTPRLPLLHQQPCPATCPRPPCSPLGQQL